MADTKSLTKSKDGLELCGVTATGRVLGVRALARTGDMRAAAAAAGVTRMAWMKAQEGDGEFAAACLDAIEQAADAVEAEARRRALDGWDEPVFQKGEQVGVIRKYSDRLTEVLLKGRRPLYRESTQVAIGGDNRIVIMAPPGPLQT